MSWKCKRLQARSNNLIDGVSPFRNYYTNSCPNNSVALLPGHSIQNRTMFAVQSDKKSSLQTSRTLEKCLSWPGSRRKTDDTLLSVTVPALCQEQTLLSGLVARPVARQTADSLSERPSLEDELAQLTAQREAGSPSEYRKRSEAPVKIIDAKRSAWGFGSPARPPRFPVGRPVLWCVTVGTRGWSYLGAHTELPGRTLALLAAVAPAASFSKPSQ